MWCCFLCHAEPASACTQFIVSCLCQCWGQLLPRSSMQSGQDSVCWSTCTLRPSSAEKHHVFNKHALPKFPLAVRFFNRRSSKLGVAVFFCGISALLATPWRSCQNKPNRAKPTRCFSSCFSSELPCFARCCLLRLRRINSSRAAAAMAAHPTRPPTTPPTQF